MQIAKSSERLEALHFGVEIRMLQFKSICR